MKGKLDDAIDSYQKAIKLDPNRAQSHFALGRALDMKDKLDDAIDSYQKAIKLDPKRYEFHFHLGADLVKRGESDQAIGYYRKAIELVAQADDGKRRMGATFLNNSAWLLATNPDLKNRNPPVALELAREAVRLDADSIGNWNTLGAAQYRAGGYKDAIAALERSMAERQGGNSFDWFFVAMANWQLGNKDEARKWYERAVDWMEKNQAKNEELLRFRAEAKELIKVDK
jgi:tetratricopeptide (TPR) repeat protein